MLASPLIKFCTICTCYFSSKLFSARNFKEPLKESILQHTKGIEMYHETKLFQVTLFFFFFFILCGQPLILRCQWSEILYKFDPIVVRSKENGKENNNTLHFDAFSSFQNQKFNHITKMAIQLSIQTHLTLKALENNKPTQALLIRKRVVIYAFVTLKITEFAFRIFEVRQKHSIRVEPNRIPFFFKKITCTAFEDWP